jgi:hypothetical protein
MSWMHVATESLRVVDSGIVREGHSVDGDYLAERFEVRVRARFFGQMTDPPRVWVRPSGAGGWQAGREHESSIPWGEVVPGSITTADAELLTYVFRMGAPPPGCPSCAPVGWLPRAPEQVRMAWTAWGPRDAPPALRVLRPSPGDVWQAGGYYEVAWEATDPDTISSVYVAWIPEAPGRGTPLGSSRAASGTITAIAPCRTGEGLGKILVGASDQRDGNDATYVEVPIVIEGAECLGFAGAELVLEPPRPNPAPGYVRFRIRALVGDLGQGQIATNLRLAIVDLRGRIVRQLPVLAYDPFHAEAAWNGTDDAGRKLPSGVYLARVDDGARSSSRRFVWLE